MTFKITIEETKEELGFTKQEWVQIGQEEIASSCEGKTILKPVWGYTPQIDTRKMGSRTIYTQEVDTLKLADVIAAVNGM